MEDITCVLKFMDVKAKVKNIFNELFDCDSGSSRTFWAVEWGVGESWSFFVRTRAKNQNLRTNTMD